MQELWICQLGVIEYREALALQERVRTARQAGALPDVLMLLEHPPVYTRGRRSDPSELPMGEAWYLSQGIDVVDADRGGKLTYHGPGQLVGYPIMLVGDVIAYLRSLERAIIAALGGEQLHAHVSDGLTGVWVGERKIASIGVHLSRSVTTHGFAINVQNDLQPFNWVVPCGLQDVQMTSIVKETQRVDPLPAFRERMADVFASEFGRRRRVVSPAELEAACVPAPAVSSAV